MFKERLQRSKPNGLKDFLYHWKDIKTCMSKMGSHHPFGHLKHKLWPKEELGIKLAVWLSTTKSQESTQFCYVQVVCDTLLENFWRGLEFCFKPHLTPRSTRKVTRPQSCKSPNFDNFETPTWESWDKKSFECEPRGQPLNIL